MKRRNNGLTIPELLVVLVIVGILAIIGIVTVNRTHEKQRQTYNMTQGTLFVETAKIYFEEHKDLLPKTLYASEYVTLDELINDKYFEDYIKDYDKNPFSGASKVKVTKIGKNKYTYTPVLLDQEGQVVVEKPDSPSTITFTYKNITKTSGKYYVNKTPYIDVTMYDEDILTGYSYVITKDGKEYRSSEMISIENGQSFTETLVFDTSVHGDGEYKIKITVYDALGNKKTKTSDTIVIDKTAPKCSIGLTGTSASKGWYKSSVSLKLNVTEKNKTGLKQGLTTSNSVTYNDKTTGTQSEDTKSKKWYGYVKDIAGNTGKCEKIVKVDTKKPVCSFANPSTDFVITGEKATIGLTCTDATSYIDAETMKFTLSDNIEISSTTAKLVSISDPVVENNGSKYTITFEGVSYGNIKISLKANSISDNVGFKNAKATSTTINTYNRAEIPTNSLCQSKTYNGKEQQLTTTTLGTGYKLSGYNQINANENGYTITATLDEGYRWSDKAATTKTFKCPLHKATPVITLDATSGTVVAGNRVTFNEKADVKGKFSVTSSNTSKATVTQASSNEVAANTNNQVTIQGVVGATTGISTITSNFTPTDTSNYNNAAAKTYTITVKKAYASNTVNGTTTYYETLQGAINASTTGTVKLLDNVTENITINSSTSKTIDLNGKTITGNVTNNGTTTISNGKIAGNVINNSGTLTINNVIITGSVTNNSGTVSITGGSIGNGITNKGTLTTKNTNITGNVINNGGTMTIDGGKVTGSVINNSGTVNLKNGEITGDVINKGTMTIENENIGGDLINDGILCGKNVTVGGKYTNNNPGGCSGGGSDGVPQDNDIDGLSTPNDTRIKVPIPRKSICVAREYAGSSQRLTSKISDTGYVLSGYDQTNAGEHTITAALIDAETYKWENNAVIAQTFKCTMTKATPTITLSESSGIIATGSTRKFTATVKSGAANGSVSGKLNVTSGSTTVATVNPNGDTTITNANNTTGVGKETTITGVAVGNNTITVKFTPSDTTNYNSASNKTYAFTVKKAVIIPTAAAYCESRTYTGSYQTLTKASGSEYKFSDNQGTNAGEYTVTATLTGTGLAWTDNSTGAKTFKCSIAKATPTITMSDSGIIAVGSTTTFPVTIKSGAANGSVSGTLNVTSGNTSVATVNPNGNITITNANAAGIGKVETITGVAAGSSTITVKFTPSASDAANYNSATNKTYSVTVKKAATIPTAAAYCNSLTYTRSEQTLVKDPSTGYTWTSGTKKTTAGSQDVVATLTDGYAWTDNSTGTKKISCSIAKATPEISLDSNSDTGMAGKWSDIRFFLNMKAPNGSIDGTLTVISNNSSVLKVSENTSDISSSQFSKTVSDSRNVVAYHAKLYYISAGSATVTIKFTPTDTNNYNSAKDATLAVTVKTPVSEYDLTSYNYCNKLTYTGSEQTLVKDPGEGFTWTSGTKRTEVGYQTVTATLKDGYIWDDYSSGTKTISCSINKATPTISLNSTSATIAVGSTVSVKATIKSGSNKTVSGTYYILKNNVSNYSKIKMSSSEFDNLGTSVSATASGTDDTEYLIAKNSPSDGSDGTDTYTIKFKPSDTDHYNESDSKTYTITVTKLTLTATFTKGTNISAISSTSASCTVTSTSNISCKVTPPNVMASTGYAVSSWTRSSGNTSSTANVNPSSTSGSLGSLEYRFASDSISLCGNTTYTATARYANSSEVQYGYNGQATVKDALDDLYSKLN